MKNKYIVVRRKEPDEIYHHGILGMKWGVRRFQYKDGSLTAAGKKRYNDGDIRGSEKSSNKNLSKKISKATNNGDKSNVELPDKDGKMSYEQVKKINRDILKKNPNAAVVDYDALEQYQAVRKERNAKIAKVAAGLAVGAAVSAAGVYYAKNRKVINAKVTSILKKNGTTNVNNLSGKTTDNDILDAMNIANKKVTSSPGNVKTAYKQYGVDLDIKTDSDVVKANWFAAWLDADVHRYDAISKDLYDTFDDNDVVLPKGKKMSRVSMQREQSVRDNTYVSFEDDDIERYKAFLPTMWRTRGNTKPPYQIELEAVGEIKSPSKKKRVDIVTDLLENDRDFAIACGFFGGDSQAHALKVYNQIATGLCDRNSVTSKKYLAKVKEMGYNAIIDDNDAGRLANNPLIVLDSSLLEITNDRKLSPNDIKTAFENVKPMSNETDDVISKLDSLDIVHGNMYKDLLKQFYDASEEISR